MFIKALSKAHHSPNKRIVFFSFFHRKRRDQALEENELLRRSIAQREEVYVQCEHDMDKAMQVMEKTVQGLSDVLQVRIGIFFFIR